MELAERLERCDWQKRKKLLQYNWPMHVKLECGNPQVFHRIFTNFSNSFSLTFVAARRKKVRPHVIFTERHSRRGWSYNESVSTFVVCPSCPGSTREGSRD